jgi:hypothetical protein
MELVPPQTDAMKAANQSQVAKDKQYQEDLQTLTRMYLTGKLVIGQLVPGTKTFRGMKVKKILATGSVNLTNNDAQKLGIDLSTTQVFTRVSLKATGGTTESNAAPNLSGGPGLGEGYGQYIESLTTGQSKAATAPEQFEITLLARYSDGEWTRSYNRSIEEMLTPGWYSNVWRNKNIGKDVYTDLLGIDAITDNVGLTASAQDKFLSQQLADSAIKDQTLLDATRTTDETGKVSYSTKGKAPPGTEYAYVAPDPTKPGSLSLMTIQPGSIEEAVDAITIMYSMVRLKGIDLHEFIKQYTNRPIANMTEILGSPDLVIDDTGAVDPKLGPNVVEGFHSRAFGDYNADVKLPNRQGAGIVAGKDALKGLFRNSPTGASIMRRSLLDRGQKPFALKPYLDPRGRARLRVKTYLQELRISRGLLG